MFGKKPGNRWCPNTQNTRGHVFQCSSWVCRWLQLQFLPYYYSDLEPIAGLCRYVPFHRGIQVSIDRHLGNSDVNLETFIVFLSAHSGTFLSACGTVERLLPALHAHLLCMTLLNSEECALSVGITFCVMHLIVPADQTEHALVFTVGSGCRERRHRTETLLACHFLLCSSWKNVVKWQDIGDAVHTILISASGGMCFGICCRLCEVFGSWNFQSMSCSRFWFKISKCIRNAISDLQSIRIRSV